MYMKPVPLLQQVVIQLCEKHGVDWQRTGAYLRLQLAGHGHLVVENIGAQPRQRDQLHPRRL